MKERKKTFKRRALAMLMALVMAFGLAQTVAKPIDAYATDSFVASGNCGVQGDNVTWKLYEDGTLEISGSGPMDDFGNNDIFSNLGPWREYANSIKSVVIDDGVTNISDLVFAHLENLTDVTIGKDVRKIGFKAFRNCESLTNVEFADGSGCQEIGGLAFQHCLNFHEISLPSTVNSLGDNIFSDIENIKVGVSSWKTLQQLSRSYIDYVLLEDNLIAGEGDETFCLCDATIDFNGYYINGLSLDCPVLTVYYDKSTLTGEGEIIGKNVGVKLLKDEYGDVGSLDISNGNIIIEANNNGIDVDDTTGNSKGVITVTDGGELEVITTANDGVAINGGILKCVDEKNQDTTPLVYAGEDSGTAEVSSIADYMANTTKYLNIKHPTTLTDWESLKVKINDAIATENHTLVLDGDYEALPGEDAITIPSGKSLTIDLKGHSIINNDDAFVVKGDLEVKDSAGGGAIKTNVRNAYSRGVLVDEGGSFTLTSGAISGFEWSGVQVEEGATFTMTGGTVENCCEFSHNNNTNGNVYINGGDFYLSGGTITGATYGGGIINNGNIYLSGSPVVKGNMDSGGTPTDIQCNNDNPIIIKGSLSGGADIGISGRSGIRFAVPRDNYTITDTDVSRFFSSEDEFCVVKEDDGLYLKRLISEDDTFYFDYGILANDLVYNGRKIEPIIQITDNSIGKLLDDDEYIYYFMNVEEGEKIGVVDDLIVAGEYVAVIEGIGDYTGTVEYPFVINPKETFDGDKPDAEMEVPYSC